MALWTKRKIIITIIKGEEAAQKKIMCVRLQTNRERWRQTKKKRDFSENTNHTRIKKSIHFTYVRNRNKKSANTQSQYVYRAEKNVYNDGKQKQPQREEK